MYFEKDNSHDLQAVIPTRHRESSLSIHPYFGKVDPSLVRKSIELYSKPGDTVLDPFCGSGTVIHDSIAMGRNAVGWDSSPLAILISTAKVLGLTRAEEFEVQSFSDEVVKNISSPLFHEPLDNGPIPVMPRIRSISDWFAPNALKELAHIRSRLTKAESVLSPVVLLFCKLAFSRIITAASLQKGESSYCRAHKPDEPGRVLNLYKAAITSIIKAAYAFNTRNTSSLGPLASDRLKVVSNGYQINYQICSASLVVTDSRKLDDSSVFDYANLITTSPPYLMSWDYGLYHKFRFYWLGFDLDMYEETEIGRHLRRKDDDVPRYVSDMSKIFHRLSRCSLSSCHVVMVNALSVVYGKEIDTNQILIDCAASANWKCIWDGPTIDIPGPHHGMYGSLESRGASAPGSAGKKEHVLIFKKNS